jgi:hypothetical protein
VQEETRRIRRRRDPTPANPLRASPVIGGQKSFREGASLTERVRVDRKRVCKKVGFIVLFLKNFISHGS